MAGTQSAGPHPTRQHFSPGLQSLSPSQSGGRKTAGHTRSGLRGGQRSVRKIKEVRLLP